MNTQLRNLAHSVGNLGVARYFNTIQTHLIFFYVDIVRLDARLVELAFAISFGLWRGRRSRSTGRSR